MNKPKHTSGYQRNSSAIKGSRSSIIVFSSNFDASTWFLEEIENILKCHRTISQMVVAVFYDVDPSDVRQQKGVFAQERWFRKNTSMRYGAAFIEVANMTRFFTSDS
ncbi:TMV resistance protein N-like, partial [Trifolium medium]|nr:TMV resistance protein N-like [Trifolium medium]